MANIKDLRNYTNQLNILPSHRNGDPNPYTNQNAKDDAVFLEERLEKTTRNLNALDFYRTTDILKNAESYQIYCNNLLPNTSFILDCDVIMEGTTIKKGSIVFKKANGEIEVIEPHAAAFFYPSKITVIDDGASSASSVKIEYSLATTFHEGSTTIQPTSGVWTINEPYEDIILEDFGSTQTYSSYNFKMSIADFDIEGFKKSTHEGESDPYIKFFNAQGEEVTFDFKLRVVDGYYKLTTDTVVPAIVSYVVIK